MFFLFCNTTKCVPCALNLHCVSMHDQYFTVCEPDTYSMHVQYFTVCESNTYSMRVPYWNVCIFFEFFHPSIWEKLLVAETSVLSILTIFVYLCIILYIGHFQIHLWELRKKTSFFQGNSENAMFESSSII